VHTVVESLVLSPTTIGAFASAAKSARKTSLRERRRTMRACENGLASLAGPVIKSRAEMTSGTSLRRTKASLIYWRTGNLRAVQLLLGQTNIEKHGQGLSIEGDDGRAFIAASPLTQKTETPVGVLLFPYSSHPAERGLGHRPVDDRCLRRRRERSRTPAFKCGHLRRGFLKESGIYPTAAAEVPHASARNPGALESSLRNCVVHGPL
jgi:hypothetical protein